MNSYCVGTCNPDPDSWVLDLIEWYLDDDGNPIEERCGAIRYFIVLAGDFIFGDSEEYFQENYPDAVNVTKPNGEVIYIPPKTFAFIHGTIFDNPALIELNPRYLSELQNLPEHEKAKQLWGNWYARAAGSNYFQREWLTEVDSFPSKAKCCRAWDKAGTEPSDLNRSPDYTASSPRIYTSEGYYYLVWDTHADNIDPRDNDKDVTGRFRLRAGDRDLRILKQAQHDGTDCHLVFAVDPSSAGKTEFEHAAKALVREGFVVKKDPMPNNKSKLVRFEPFASACQNGLVKIVRSSFPNKATYDAYMRELEAFSGLPSTSLRKDDWADATASAFNYISKMKTIRDFVIPLTGGGKTLMSSLRNTLG
jgi:phage terminase large subunit-like protein